MHRTPLLLRLDAPSGSVPCGLCRQVVHLSGGPHLSVESTLEPVCSECGKQHAPTLTTLLELARAAEYVGRIGRHTISPPLTALLELARAAENYTATLPQRRQEAA